MCAKKLPGKPGTEWLDKFTAEGAGTHALGRQVGAEKKKKRKKKVKRDMFSLARFGHFIFAFLFVVFSFSFLFSSLPSSMLPPCLFHQPKGWV